VPFFENAYLIVFSKILGAGRKRPKTIRNKTDTFVPFFENAYLIAFSKNLGAGRKRPKTIQNNNDIFVYFVKSVGWRFWTCYKTTKTIAK